WSNAEEIIVSNNIICNIISTGSGIGIFIDDQTGTNNIYENEIYEFSSRYGSGIRVNTGNCNINNNRIYSFHSYDSNHTDLTGITVASNASFDTISNNKICDFSVIDDGIIKGI